MFFFCLFLPVVKSQLLLLFPHLFLYLQRLIPVDSGNDLFVYKAPDVPTHKVYTIRPYLPEDEAQVYSVCHRTCKDGLEDSHPLPETFKNLAADKSVYFYVVLRVGNLVQISVVGL